MLNTKTRFSQDFKGKEWSQDFLPDIIANYVSEIENSLLACGSMPGADYTRLDLHKLALPLVESHLKNNGRN